MTTRERAYAVALTPVIGYVLPTASVTPDTTFAAWYRPLTIGLGGFVEFQMFKGLSLETGILYGARGFNQIYSDATSTLTLNSIQIPLLLRARFAKQISVGMGPYFSHAVGSYHSTTDGLTEDIPFSFSTFGADDYGMIASLRFQIGLAFSTSLILDARYVLGLQNISHYEGVSVYLRDVQALGGIRFGI